MTKRVTPIAADLDTFFDELHANGEIRTVEIDDNTEFTAMSFDCVLDMLKTRILDRLPPAVRQDILSKE